MDQSESQSKFKEAGSLFKQGRHQEALTMLEELNRAHPNTQRVLYPMALCLSELQRIDDAMKLVERLVLEFDYEPARKLQLDLQKKLEESSSIEGLTGLADLDLGLSGGSSFGSPAGSPAQSSAGPPVIHAESFTSKYFNLILVSVFLMVLALFVVLFKQFGLELAEWQEALLEQPDTIPPIPIASLIYNVILYLILTFFAGCVGAYCGLAVVQALPEDDFNDNMKDIALYALYGTLLMIIPIFGWIAILVIIYKHYDLRVGSLIVTVFLCVIVWLVIYFGLSFFIGLAAAFL